MSVGVLEAVDVLAVLNSFASDYQWQLDRDKGNPEFLLKKIAQAQQAHATVAELIEAGNKAVAAYRARKAMAARMSGEPLDDQSDPEWVAALAAALARAAGGQS